MKKALSYLLALAMVVTMIPAAAFADKKADEAMTPEKALEALKGYGVIKGDGTQDPFKPESELKRQDAAVILVRLLGVEKEAKALEVKEKPFMDIPSDDFYKSIIQYVKDKGIFKGISAEKFGFNDKLTAQQFATIQLRALGYEVESEDAYKKALETAKKMGLLKGTSELKDDTKILRKDVYVIMNNTLETPKKDGKKALKYELGLAQEPVAEKLEVKSVKALGLKVVQVEFSKEVDKETLDKIEAYDKDDAEKDFGKHLLMEDKKTANLVFETKVKQNETLKIVVEDVKSADKKEKVEKYTEKILFVDTERPVVESVEALNPRELVIAVSEPIDLETKSYKKIKEIKIDDIPVYAKVANDYNGKLQLTLYKPLKEGDHKVVIDGIKDYAELPSSMFEQDITVVDDKEAPAIAEAKMITTKEIHVTFNENLETVGEFKVDGKAVNAGYVDQDVSKKEIRLTLKPTDELKMGAIVEVKVEYKGQKDIMGNAVKNWEKFSFTVSDDTDLPTAEFSGFDKDNSSKVEIKFSKNMNLEGEWKLKDEKGKVKLSGKAESAASLVSYKKDEKDVLVFDLSKELNGKDSKDYTLVLEKFKDATVRHNEMPKTEIAFKSKDALAPVVLDGNPPAYDGAYSFESEVLKDGYSDYKYTMVFSEKMDEETLKDKSNYTIQVGVKKERLDQIKDAEVKIRVLDDARKVQIVIRSKTAYTNAAKFYLIGLKDESGFKMKNDSLIQHAPTNKPTLKVGTNPEVSLNSDGKYELKFIFAQKVKVINSEKFYLQGEDGSLAFKGEADKFSDELVFEVEKYEFPDNAATTKQYEIASEAVENARGEKNNQITGGTYTDKVAPRIAKDDDGKEKFDVVKLTRDQIKIDFTEKIDKVVSVTVVDKESGQALENVDGDVANSPNEHIVFVKLPKHMANGDEYLVSISVKDLKGNISEVYKRELLVAGLGEGEAPIIADAELDYGVAEDRIKVKGLDGSKTYRYEFGSHFVALDTEKAASGSVQNYNAGDDIRVNAETALTVYQVEGNKVKAIAVFNNIQSKKTAEIDEPSEIKLVTVAENGLTIGTSDIKTGNVDATGLSTGKHSFAVKFTKAVGAGNQKVTLTITKGTSAVPASPIVKVINLNADNVTSEAISLNGITDGQTVTIDVEVEEVGKTVYSMDSRTFTVND